MPNEVTQASSMQRVPVKCPSGAYSRNVGIRRVSFRYSRRFSAGVCHHGRRRRRRRRSATTPSAGHGSWTCRPYLALCMPTTSSAARAPQKMRLGQHREYRESITLHCCLSCAPCARGACVQACPAATHPPWAQAHATRARVQLVCRLVPSRHAPRPCSVGGYC